MYTSAVLSVEKRALRWMSLGGPDEEVGIEVSLVVRPRDSRLIGECAHVWWALDGHQGKPAEL